MASAAKILIAGSLHSYEAKYWHRIGKKVIMDSGYKHEVVVLHHDFRNIVTNESEPELDTTN